jgi:hypothetical protein
MTNRFQILATLAVLTIGSQSLTGQNKEMPVEQHVIYHTVRVNDISIFYREAGPKTAPTILLLHGLPSSSRMFQPLLTRLGDKYHLIGTGLSWIRS